MNFNQLGHDYGENPSHLGTAPHLNNKNTIFSHQDQYLLGNVLSSEQNVDINQKKIPQTEVMIAGNRKMSENIFDQRQRGDQFIVYGE